MPHPVHTLKKRADFLRLNRGRKFICPYFILRYASGDGGAVRLGYTVTTKCGNAVIRNRIKRRLRALARPLAAEHGIPGMDYVFIARADAKPGAGDVAHALLAESVAAAFARAARDKNPS